ncbi:MAG: hypothetical protein K8I03_06445 [Ignavibacteria bacterium]|nr:hypothetical protein [Ignavibacteria bacterium]
MPTTAHSQSVSNKFIDALIYGKPEIIDYVNKKELANSQRLGIQYNGVKNKFHIGNDIPEEIKAGIKNGKYKYEITEKPLEDFYTEVTFKVPDANYSKVFYFNDGFVTSSTYISRNWEKIESKYFSFSIQEPKYFNDYCTKRLDQFVDMVADTLGFTISEKRILEKEKIGYVFCSDENEVKNITGFSAKGMAMLGTDEVVSSYQTNFHEVAHILINFKLKNLGLYTLPFFMEGFAVAMGGRGGMAPRVVTDLGYYLQKTGFLTYDSILTNDAFYSQDANMTYAVSGLYNSFLLSELGGEKYLEMYKKMNGDLEFVRALNDCINFLPKEDKYSEYLNDYSNDKIIYVNPVDTVKPIFMLRGINGTFAVTDDYIKFFVVNKYKIGFPDLKLNPEYSSRKYFELFGEGNYDSYKYMIFSAHDNISVYDLYNDELIFSYDKGLSIRPVDFPSYEGFYMFFLRKKIFDVDFENNSVLIDGAFR